MKRFVLAVMIIFCSVDGYANCMQSFNVKPEKSVTNVGWLPGNEGVITTMNCSSLETIRTNMFVEGDNVIDPETFKDITKYKSKVEDTLNRIKNLKKDLDSALDTDATIDALVKSYKVLKFAAAKTVFILVCYESKGIACAKSFAALLEEIKEILDGSLTKTEVSEKSKNLQKEIDDSNDSYKKLLENEASFNMDTASQQYNSMFEGMCKAIQDQCL